MSDPFPVKLANTAGRGRRAVLEILSDYQLEPELPSACELAAREQLAHPGLDDPGLKDLTDLPFITIDNADSRDLDQALLMQADAAEPGYRVLYALADASWYVRPGSALFDEALRRGATFYVPGLSVPMLPRSLSEGLISLNPFEDRRALVFDIHLDENGRMRDTKVYRARIRSQAKLSYAYVQELLDAVDRGEGPQPGPAYLDSILNLRIVGEKRIQLARLRNVIEYKRSNPRVVLSGEKDRVFDIVLRERNDVERYNEQISLLCNMEGARLLEKYARLTPELQSVFRVHVPPLAQRLTELRQQIDRIVAAHGLTGGWRWSDEEDLADYLQRLPSETTTRRIRQSIERQIMLTNNASQFTGEAGPHHALGVDAYARFSSPMREVVGIFTHKELLEALELEAPLSRAADRQIQARVIETANRAKQLQKRLDKEFQLRVIAYFLHADLDQPTQDRPLRRGTLMGMDARRVFVSVDGFALDLKVYREDLEDHWGERYLLQAAVAQPVQGASPVFRVGDQVGVRALDWDSKRRRFLLELAKV